MALLELRGNQYPIPVGELVLGSDAGCGIVVSGSGILPRHALFQGQPDGHVVIRKAAPAAEVLINGVRLGAEPTPLLHGDKVEVNGHELNFVDERRSGSTRFMQAVKPPEATIEAKGTSPSPGATAKLHPTMYAAPLIPPARFNFRRGARLLTACRKNSSLTIRMELTIPSG